MRPPERTKRVTNLNIREVPTDTRDQFKGYCATRGYSMQAALIALMKKATREDLPLPEARRDAKGKCRPARPLSTSGGIQMEL